MIIETIFIALVLGSVLAFQADRLPEKWHAWIVPLPALVALLGLVQGGRQLISEGVVLSTHYPWVKYLELNWAFQLNGWGLMMALLIVGIGFFILVYATGYMHGHPLTHRIYGYLYIFMLAMVGVVLSDHLLLLFVFWELTSISSYLLIGFNHADTTARKNALQALLVTGMGGMALLAGIILLYAASGTWYISELIGHRETILNHALYPGILVTILLGAFTKSAQFPFHFWLPNAMAAPTPVSAYLHSATMVKAGVYLMAIMLPVIGGTPAWTWTLVIAGGVTLWIGGFSGLQQTDLKRILAGTTLAVLGLLTLMLGIGTEAALKGMLMFLWAHAFYKATLFMVAGAVDHETGTRDVRLLGNLRKSMPVTAFAALIAALSKMGIPLFFGFLGKEYVYKGAMGHEFSALVLAVLVIGNALIVALAIKAGILPFWKKNSGTLPKKPHEAPWSMRLGPLFLGVGGVILGICPFFFDPLLTEASRGVLGYGKDLHIHLWQGFNLALVLSVVTLLLGLAILYASESIKKTLDQMPLPKAENGYDSILGGVLSFATWQTLVLQSGYLRRYLLWIIGATFALVASKLWHYLGIDLALEIQFAHPEVWAVTAVMLGGITLAVITRSRLTALIGLGAVGYGIAFIYAIFSAPDLAVTQILVETLSVALFAWVVFRFPEFKCLSSKGTLWFDGFVSAIVGVMVTIMVLKSRVLETGESISETLSEWSLVKAHGANVVNVILVDFRALDTWGEITVLGIASLGVWALLVARKKGEKAK